MKIVFLGDSLTYGYGVKRKASWVNLIDEVEGIEAINRGINGDTTFGMLSRFKSDVIDWNPNIVHIMGGANDIICNATEDSLKPNLMAMVHQAQAYGIRPVIGISPSGTGRNIPIEWSAFTDFRRVADTMLRYRDWLFEFCKAFGIEYIDYHSKLFEYAKGMSMEELFFDGLHLSEEANAITAQIFLDYLRDKRETE